VAHTAGSVGPDWKKSSRSAANRHCVEVPQLAGSDIGEPHSKNTGSGCPVPIFTYEERLVVGYRPGLVERIYTSAFVPVLLQTTDYARAILRDMEHRSEDGIGQSSWTSAHAASMP
jgi:hypothetical protein